MEKSKLSIVMVGHVDHGKSTLIGRLLYDTNSVSNDKIAELEKASMKTGNKLEFAFLLDHLREEREQGITIDTAQTFFYTQDREYQIIDAPGHVEFVKNMITGASQASSAVLIIDVKEGVMQQTKRHLFILALLGIKDLIVVVNKMDKVDYSETLYLATVKEIKSILELLKLQSIYFIPVSALDGDNICKKSDNMPWYRGETLIDVMEKIEGVQNSENLPFVFPIQDVYKVADKRIVVGRLEAGKIHINDIVKVIKTGQYTKIRSIEKFLETPQSVRAGECVGMTTEDAIFLERGDVLSAVNTKIQYGEEFIANMIWLDREPVQVNEKLFIRCGTQEEICTIEKIQHKINTGQLVEVEKNAMQLEELDASKVVIKTKKQIAFSKYVDYKSTGRFVLMRDKNICAGGIIV